MVSKDVSKSPSTQKVPKSGSTNFHKARQLFESISNSSDQSSENIHSSSSELPLKKTLNASLNEFDLKKQLKSQKPSVISIFQNTSQASKLENKETPLLTQKQENILNSSTLNSPPEKALTVKSIVINSPVETKTPASEPLDKASGNLESYSSSSSNFISANSSVDSLYYHSSPAPLSPSSKLVASDQSVDGNSNTLNLAEELGQASSSDQIIIPSAQKDSLPVNTENNNSSLESSFTSSTENPSNSSNLIPHLTNINPPLAESSQKATDHTTRSGSSFDNKTPILPHRVVSNSYSSTSLSRISCLNSKDLEPSLSTVLETIELDDSSAQSSTRHSTDFSVYSDTPTLELQQEFLISQTSSLGGSVAPVNPNAMGGLVFDKLLARLPNYSETCSPPTESSKPPVYIRTSSHNSEPSIQSSNKNRPESIVSYFSADVAPSPPPKSHLRSLQSQIKTREALNEKHSKHNRTSGQEQQPNKPSIRKLSDPEIFAKGLTSLNRPHARSVSNRTYSRGESSTTSPLIDSNKASSAVPAAPATNLPIRLQSLDHFKSTSEETKEETTEEITEETTEEITGAQSTKQMHIIDEILSTESAYLMDLNLLKEIYLEGASSREDLFLPRDLKLIFINLEEIISFSETFLSELRLNSGFDPSPRIGNIFVTKHKDLQSVYSQYFKMHEVSTAHLQDMLTAQPLLVQFLESCDANLKQRSKSWDLPSLLIKPIQRVLKYPLLIKELLDVTDPSNLDYDDLVTASVLIKGTADYYNELKRRKDVIDRIICPKGCPKGKKQDLHIRAELNKKFFRGAQHLKKIAGIKNKTVDGVYDLLAEKFHCQEAMLRRFWDEVQMWTLAVEETYNTKDRQARGFLALYAPPASTSVVPSSVPSTVPSSVPHHHHHLFSAEFCKLTSNLAREMVSFLNHEVYTVLFEKINQLIRLFNTPALLMKKRDRKLFDYDSLSSKEGSKTKRNINESAQAYQLINKELINELPLFLNLSKQMFTVLLAHFAWIQQQVYRRAGQQLARLLVAFERPHHLDDNIVRLFNTHSLGEGILDPFVKATHALMATANPNLTSARITRSLSSETVSQSVRLSRSPATYLSQRRSKTSKYPGIPTQFYDSQSETKSEPKSETSSVEIKPSSDTGNDSDLHEEETEDDNASISALDGSFLVGLDPTSRRDHLLVDVDPGLFNLPIFPDLDADSVIKNNSASSSSLQNPENRLPKLAKVSKNLDVDDLLASNCIGPSDQESRLSSSVSDLDFKTTILLSRHCSRTSTNENYPRSVMSLEENTKGLDSLLKVPHNHSTDSLNSSHKSISKVNSYDSSSSTKNSFSKPRPDNFFSNGLGSVTGSMKSSHRNSSKSTARTKNKPRPVLFECKAVFPYSAASETELSLVPGMELRVFKCSTTTSCPWWYGEDIITNNRGWFPSSFCKNISSEK